MTIRGVSSLGLAHKLYPIHQIPMVFKPGNPIVFKYLWGTFGKFKFKITGELLANPREKILELVLLNGAGLNNKRMQPREFGHKYGSHEIFAQTCKNRSMRLWQDFGNYCDLACAAIMKYTAPGTLKLIINPWLEHGPISEADYNWLVSSARDSFKHCPYVIGWVDNPRDNRAKGFSGYLLERHGTKHRGGDIVDLDGDDWREADMAKFNRLADKAEYAFIWSSTDNGFATMDDAKHRWIYPKTRKHFSYPGKWGDYYDWVNERGIWARKRARPTR